MINGEYLLIKSSFLVEYAKHRLACKKNAESTDYKNFLANRFSEALELSNNIYNFDGQNATIKIFGPLSVEGPDAWDVFHGMGGCSYNNIMESAIRAAHDVDSNIGEVFIDMNTPGGTVDGCDAAFQALWQLSLTHRITVRNHGLICSAGMWLAAASHTIEAATPAALQGSIGVVLNTYDFSGMLEEFGIEEIVITNFESPDKVPDLSTEKGKEIVREELDDLYDVFVGRVLQGRNRNGQKITKAIINNMKGRVAIASKAVNLGLSDSINEKASSSSSTIGDLLAGKTSTFRDYPIVDIEWDGDAAEGRWREFTGSQEGPSSDYPDGFFWYDDEQAELFGSYKLNFVDIVDGKPVAIRNGIFAANGSMQGARDGVDIPDEDRPEVQAHIDRYLAKIEKEDEENEEESKREGVKMKLSDLLAKDPEAKKEHQDALAAAKTEGVEVVRADAKIAMPILTSAEYPAAIKEVAAKVVTGEVGVIALTSAVSAFDAVKEQKASTSAAAEPVVETPADDTVMTTAASGKVVDQQSYDDNVSVLKRAQGIK